MLIFSAIVNFKKKYLKISITTNKCTILKINEIEFYRNKIKTIQKDNKLKIWNNYIQIKKIILKNKGLKIKKYNNIIISKFLKSNYIFFKNNCLIKKINKNILIFIKKNNTKKNYNNDLFIQKNYFDSKNIFFSYRIQKIKKPKKK